MMTFEEIWTEFSWVIDEFNAGMAFFEGYLPAISMPDIANGLQEFSTSSAVSHACEPCWKAEEDIPEVEQDYSVFECVDLLRAGKLADFQFFYRQDHGWIKSNQKLIVSVGEAEPDVTLICFSDWILTSGKPKEAVEVAISEMRYLKGLLKAGELYIGADGLDWSYQKGLRID